MKSINPIIKTNILHCFGFKPEHKLTTSQTIRLLKESGNPWITFYFSGKDKSKINTIGDFSIGHAGLSAKKLIDRDSKITNNILLTTDKAKSFDEAIEMSLIVNSCIFEKLNVVLKLEVLDYSETYPINSYVIEATKKIKDLLPKQNIWPIINYNKNDVFKLKEYGAQAVRVIWGPIGSNGTARDLDNVAELGRIGLEIDLPIIIEGGLGNDLQVYEVLKTPGISAVLVNSCLFKVIEKNGAIDPIYMIKKIKHAAQLALFNKPFSEYCIC
jgi:thiazole synthase ThiGH ThiG subunit